MMGVFVIYVGSLSGPLCLRCDILENMNTRLAILIRNLYIAYCFIARPNTRGAKVGIFCEGKILLVRLSYYPDTWTFPGGALGKKETPEEAAIRECREEVGIVLQDLERVGSLYLEQQYKKDTVSVFRAKATNPAIFIDGKEVIEADWYDPENLPQMGENTKSMLNLILKQE